MIQGEKLRSHTGLVAEEVSFLSLWSALEFIERCNHCEGEDAAMCKTLHDNRNPPMCAWLLAGAASPAGSYIVN
jgi:hypothetical protein